MEALWRPPEDNPTKDFVNRASNQRDNLGQIIGSKLTVPESESRSDPAEPSKALKRKKAVGFAGV